MKSTKRITRTSLLLGLLVLTFCGQPTEAPNTTMPADILATYESETVSVTDMDTRILRLPPRERPAPGEDLDSWFREQARVLLLERMLLKRAKENQLEAEEPFQRASEMARRNLVFQAYYQEFGTKAERIDDERLKEAYETHKDNLRRPERRAAFHIFRRCSEQACKEQAKAELSGLRMRILQGENFKKLAKDLSDSETRHREGSLGWLSKDTLEADLAQVIFSLEEGVPSEPVTTADGVHLFFVDIILREQSLSFEEAKPNLAELIRREEVGEAVTALMAKIEEPDGLELPNRESFDAMMQSPEPESVLIKHEDTTITVADFRMNLSVLLGDRGRQGAERISLDRAWQGFETLKKMVLIDLHATKNQLVNEELIRERLRVWERNALMNEQRRRSLLALAEADTEKLKLFYESNIGRFSTPVRVNLDLLRIPLDDQATTTMANLEQAAKADNVSLENLAKELGGKVETLGWKSIPELKFVQIKLPSLISTVEPGQLSAPFRAGKFIEIAYLRERESASPRPFETVKQEVAEAYAENYKALLYKRLLETWIVPDKLIFNPAGLDALRGKAKLDTDVSADDLEKMLEELEQSR